MGAIDFGEQERLVVELQPPKDVDREEQARLLVEFEKHRVTQKELSKNAAGVQPPKEKRAFKRGGGGGVDSQGCPLQGVAKRGF